MSKRKRGAKEQLHGRAAALRGGEPGIDHMQVWSLPAAQTLYSNLQLQSSTATLEVGVGHGGSLPLLAALLPTTARYVATDLDGDIVRDAEARAAALGLAARGFEFSAADAADLSAYADGAFDRVAANFLLHLLPDPAAALAECHRVLAPGGLAAFSLWGAKKDSLMYTLQGKVMRRLGVGAEATRTHPNFQLGSDEAALRTLFERAGFSRVVLWHQPSVLPAMDGTTFVRQRLEEGDTDHVALVEQSLAVVLEDVDLSVPQFKKALRAAAEGVLRRGGPLALDTIVVIACICK